jgi:hypothetical protein
VRLPGAAAFAAYSFSETNHHGATAAFLAAVHNGRREPVVDHALAC